MVGIVIISHSHNVAKGAYELAKMMAPTAPVAYAGGLDDGSLGTDYGQIEAAMQQVASEDGIIVLVDMGSALMTAEMVIESMPEVDIRIADCPVVEGSVSAAVSSMVELDIGQIMASLMEPNAFQKIM